MRGNITEKTRAVRDRKNRNKAAEVEERKLARTRLSSQAQIKALDDRLGVGIGAAKERKRLMQ